MTVYLIGGPPKCGKTTLAKELSKRLGIPWISADTLQNIARVYIDARDDAKLFPHSALHKGNTNDEFYRDNSSDTIIENYVEQGRTSYPAISVVAETQIVDGDDYIIEGYQVTPEAVDEIIKKFGAQNIKAVFLGKHDERKFLEDLHKSTTPNDWIIRKTKEAETFPRIAKMVSDYSRWFEAEAKKYGFPTINMDENFESQIENAMGLLGLEKSETEKLRRS